MILENAGLIIKMEKCRFGIHRGAPVILFVDTEQGDEDFYSLDKNDDASIIAATNEIEEYYKHSYGSDYTTPKISIYTLHSMTK